MRKTSNNFITFPVATGKKAEEDFIFFLKKRVLCSY